MGKLIGLTGQTGAGKSTVANILQKNGYYIIDGDVLARQVVEKGSPVLESLCEAFGRDILQPDGTLNRATLAERAFADAKSTAMLNAITHPAIIRMALELAQEAFSDGFDAAVFDAAGLFESGMDKNCAAVIAVTAPEELRLERIMKRDGIDERAARRRISAQKPESFYTEHSDYVIRNIVPELLEEEVGKALTFMQGL